MALAKVDFDTIVVGAGAGGAAAAYCLGQAGLRVLAVEKARLPRYKACGGAIPRPTLDRFPFEFDSVIHAVPTEVRIAFPGLPTVNVPLPDRPVVMVMRSEFDALLLDHSGAEVLDRTIVQEVTESEDCVQIVAGGRRITARTLVGADGATSTVAKKLGLRQNRRLGGTLEAEVPLNGNSRLRLEYGERALFSLTAVPWGYAWVFPKGNSLSVGIGQFRPGRVNLRLALQQEMDRLGIDLDGIQVHGHPLPSYQAPPWFLWRIRPQEPLSTKRCALVGDAAGLVDPLLGEGIRYAISSARLAAEVIASGDLSNYERRIWQEMGHSLATASQVAGLFYRFPRLCYNVGLRNPEAIRDIADVLTERRSYRGIGRRMFAASGEWLLCGKARNPRNQYHAKDGEV